MRMPPEIKTVCIVDTYMDTLCMTDNIFWEASPCETSSPLSDFNSSSLCRYFSHNYVSIYF